METHHTALLEMLVETVRNHYTHDIAIMIVYGSYVDGTLTPTSDLDVIIVPKTDKGWNLARTFMFNGTGNDIFGVGWEHLERYASFDDMKVSVLACSQLVYYDEEADRAHYEALIQQVHDIEQGPLTQALIEKAERRMTTVKQYYGELCLGHDLSAVGGILYEIGDVICLLNHTYLRSGYKHFDDEIIQFALLPEGFLQAFHAVSDGSTREAVIRACHNLISLIDSFLPEVRKVIVPQGNVQEFEELYEEMSSHWNKLRRACATGDRMMALTVASVLQSVFDMVQKHLGTDIADLRLVDQFTNGLQALLEAGDRAERTLVRLLQEGGLTFAQYDNLEALQNDLSKEP